MAPIRSFPPISAPSGRVMILGSMPGEASLAAHEYYAHPRNLFWPLMGALVGAGPELPYARRIEALTAAGILLWDVLHSCTRPGSLDSAIRDEAPNDVPALLADQPGITHVFFNGAKAEQAFHRHFGARLAGLVTQRLPSTSPAHAALDYSRKLAAWQAVAAALRRAPPCQVSGGVLPPTP